MANLANQSPDVSSSPWLRGVVTVLTALIAFAALAWALDLYRKVGLIIYTEQYLAGLLALALAAVFLHIPVGGGLRGRLPWYDLAATLLALGATGYIALRYQVLIDELPYKPVDGIVVGAITTLLTLEALRRVAGIFLVIVIAGFVLYGLFGNLIPQISLGRPIPADRMALFLSMDPNSVLGTPLRVVGEIVVAFIFLGTLLMKTGGSAFFTDISLALMGRYRGGPAKIAVTASALFGSISGSAVSNVVSTGVVTIPLMKQAGYQPHQAGAIEAVASTGGQLMPPIMGAAAFLMAEFLNIPYADVVRAAVFPALLYYIALLFQADLEAAKLGITSVALDRMPRVGRVLADGWYFPLPFVVLIAGIFRMGLRPETAALYGAVTLIICSVVFGYHGRRLSPRDFLQCLPETGHSVLDVLVISAAAGMVIGVLSLSGVGFSLTLGLVQLGGNSAVVLLVLAAALSILLGMGMPTVGVYVLLATLVAPALIKSGLSPISAHLFVMYYGMMSMITPPIAIAAFTAASVAHSDPVRTGFTAVRFGWAAYVVPFIFVVSPSLLLVGSPGAVLLAVITAIVGIWLGSAGVCGYFVRPMSWPVRIFMVASGVALLIPANTFPGAIWTDITGIVVGVVLVARELHAVGWFVRQLDDYRSAGKRKRLRVE